MLKKWYLFLLGLVLIPTLTFALNVTLTDAIARETTGFPIQPSFSKNGDQAYLVYEIAVIPTEQNLAAEIFFNQNGILQSSATLIGDLDFPSIDNGFANPDFTRFSLIDDNALDTVRIRLFDRFFNQIAVNTFDDFKRGNHLLNPSFSAQGGVFSPDGKFIVMTYLIDTTVNNQKTIMRILNAEDLTEVTNTVISGGSKGPIFFSHDNETYIALTTYGGDFIFSFENPLAAPPSILAIYKLKNSELSFVDQVSLPQQGNVPSFINREGKTLIGVGTVRAELDGETTIFKNSVNNQSYLPDDSNELRIYRFDGRRLKLILANKTGITTTSPVFSPKGMVLINEQATDGHPGFFNFYSLCGRKEKGLKSIKGTFASPPFAYDIFSPNGKWLLVTGSNTLGDELNNINLYRIGSDRCATPIKK